MKLFGLGHLYLVRSLIVLKNISGNETKKENTVFCASGQDIITNEGLSEIATGRLPVEL